MLEITLEILSSTWLLLVLLNPFLLIVYLIKLVDTYTSRQFCRTLLVAGVISIVVFITFAILGDLIFSVIFQAHFASFQIFGGIVFLIIGLDVVFKGPGSLELLRAGSKDIASSIAMPILVGPGSVSASVLIGERLPPLFAAISVTLAVVLSITMMIVLKYFFDISRHKAEKLLERYIEIAGRILGLYLGTISIEMIITGLASWFKELAPIFQA